MDIVKKIDKLRVSRGWTFYKLSQESGLSQQTFTQWFNNNTIPTIPALISVCNAFGITLADLFAENNLIEVTPRLQQLYNNWCILSPDEQNSVELIINNYIKNKNQ